MGEPEEIKRFDIKTIDDDRKWIQIRYLKLQKKMIKRVPEF